MPYLTLTTSRPPNSKQLKTLAALPIGCVFRPIIQGEPQLPIVKYPGEAIVRCRACNAYLSPYSRFLNHGRQWDCLLCKTINPSPEEYFSADGSLPNVPELTCLEFDIMAPESFVPRPPMPCTYIFLVDCSFASCSTGFMASTCESIKLLIENSALPGAPRTEVALIGFGGSVHLFDLSADNPTIIDLAVNPDDVFLPLPKDRLLVNLEDNSEAFLKALDGLMKVPSYTRVNSVRSALTVAVQLLTGRGGKIVLFNGHTNLGDSARPREFVLAPFLQFYRDMIHEMAKNEISCDLFMCASEYANLSALSELARYSGGTVFFYPDFMAHRHFEKLRNELWKCMTATTIWEGAMRVRTSTDWNSTSVYGNYIMKNERMAAFGSMNSNKSIAFEFELETPIASSQILYVQAAILHTTSDGQRLIRVINRAYECSGEISEVVNGVDIEATVNLLTKKAVSFMNASGNFKAGRGVIEEFGSNFLMLAKRNAFPQTYYMAAYLMGLCKHPTFGDENANYNLLHDLHSYRRQIAISYGPELSSLLAYPRLYAVHDLEEPKSLQSTSKLIMSDGVYLLDTGLELLLWIGREVQPEVCSALFGKPSYRELIDVNEDTIRSANTPEADSFLGFLDNIRSPREIYPTFRAFLNDDSDSNLFFSRLAEDRSNPIDSFQTFLLSILGQ
eukprot:CAMPEP_0204900628 /NCGR_PEP_ID=MMETSP1397-20131031/2588_1 /ASSEMBLY_ACC=CAM_ASM_000891 /TAXON_ID=49980 /ORGANISM="Climacostomum Climacostomum virens, Strain Stock W-24" /LENGTH=674 /DNA_ID=CAMNT_0052068811 /DNA_START=125 /DNA_END=2149 /DNA_ORIENTATION=+